MLKKELDRRLETYEENLEWFQVKQDLKSLKEVIIEESGNTIAVRKEALGNTHKVFQAVRMALPPTIRKISYVVPKNFFIRIIFKLTDK